MITVTLPFPPGVNNLFATYGNRRIRTRRYEAWIAEAGARLIKQNRPRIAGPFHFTLTADRPDNRKRDLDGLAKAPLDLLVKHEVIEDDSLSRSIRLAWSDLPPSKPGRITVQLEAAS